MKPRPLHRLSQLHPSGHRLRRPRPAEEVGPSPAATRTSLQGFAERAAAEAQVLEAKVLDVATFPDAYRPLFTTEKYESIALPPAPGRFYPGLVSSFLLNGLPISSDGFDLLLCTRVLEEAPEPQAMMVEFARVLGDAGLLFLAAPLIVHEPARERPRNQLGLNYLLEAAGFVIEDLMPVERSRCYAVIAKKRGRTHRELRPRHDRTTEPDRR